MREVSGTTWSFQMIILFILIFACFLSLVVQYSKAFRAKNEMVSIIEKYEGITLGDEGSLAIINNYLYDTAYRGKGRCPVDDNSNSVWYGALDLEGTYEAANASKNYSYCFQKLGRDTKYYYNIKVFYRFNLPVLGDLGIFSVSGRTNSFIGNENDAF